LCYQIAKELYGDRGGFTSIDDSGGGDGVEFYMTLPNGDQWGWQAKFYYPGPRLSVSNRKQSIEGSLKKACQKHVRLKKWILCTPSNFTPQEQAWFENTLCQSISQNMGVELQHWGDSDFNAWLSEPRFSGKRNYFFGELELNVNWFETQFDKQKASVHEKFNPCLHTETLVDANLHALLGDKMFVHQITEWIEKLEGELSNLKEAIDDLKRPIPDKIEWGKEKSKVIVVAESLQHTLVNAIGQLEQARKLLNEKRLSETQAIDWESVLIKLEKAHDTYGTVGTESGISKIRYAGGKEDEERVLREATWIVHRPGSLIANLLDDFFQSAMKRLRLINQTDLNILGDAGIGKTHIACNICHDRLDTELPALFIRGICFTSDRPLEEQLRNILDIPPSYSWNDFLQALSAAAEAYHTRIPLIIDGLNESTHNGAFSNVWRLGLKGLVQEIAQTKNLVLITTCRTSYKEAIWGDKNPPNMVHAYGFDTYEVEEAVDKYFNEYKIKADLTAAPLTQFEHPIYLKIFCESKNPARQTEKQVYIGEQTLFGVFEEYLKQCNRAVCDRLGLHHRTSIVQPALIKMAEYMWQHSSRHIPLDELVVMIDGKPLTELDWLSSKTHAIESEGLLVYRDWIEVGEAVYFTYDLLGGYVIARYLVEQNADGIQNFLRRKEVVATLFSGDHQRLHPLYSDISRCLAALLPSKTGQFLHRLLDNEAAFSLSIEALFEISPRDISEDCIDLVSRLFKHPENRKPLIGLAKSTVGHVNHPFNASFWSERLMELTMPERDVSWTEYVRENVESFEKLLTRFEETLQSGESISDTTRNRLHLIARYIMWVLTSTVRPLRDKATRALCWYGRRFPEQFFELVMESLSINDTYVSERMLAATYGIAMARQYDFEDASFARDILPLYGRQLYEAMFKLKASRSTTHILARDYARRTIDIALLHHSSLLTDDERVRITPPFKDGGIREWGKSEDKNKGEYRDGNAPLGMDFSNYTLGRLVKGRGNYDFEHEGYKCVSANISWRIYDLGYSLQTFGKIDKWLAGASFRQYGRSNDGGKTDRYGKKYSWIAYYELAGFRQDQRLLSDYYDDLRISDADIDPSFPGELQKYNLVQKDFLGNRDIPVEDWILCGGVPDLDSYLIVDEICGEQGPWVLLDGFINQTDSKANRRRMVFVRSFIAQSGETEQIVEKLKQQKTDGTRIPEPPDDYYTYAGEIPWCDTYPESEWSDLSFVVGTKTVSEYEERQVLLRNGQPMSQDEVQEFFENIDIKDLIEKDDEEGMDKLLSEQGLEAYSEKVKVERRVEETEMFKVLTTVRNNNWEDYHSVIISGRSVLTPAKQIAKNLGLCGRPQTFDLFEKNNGRRASITFGYGADWWHSSQKFAFIRQDLLAKFLGDSNTNLIWVMRGEREFFSNDTNEHRAFANTHESYQPFQVVRTYSQTKNFDNC